MDPCAQYWAGLIKYWNFNNDEGIGMIKMSADGGFAAAQCDMGELERSLGKVEEARNWYEMAVEGGDRDAMYGLFLLLEAERNTVDRHKYLVMAAKANHNMAIQKLSERL